ncbi:hypothetical protein [Lacticaseibacillus nasuensis]|uniref:hypothetical protein n=1 Tax=Lacticaseibacillus nasuensis TaxID=944671 RepID=UPI0006D1E608|nr:hypothetical protein [Lacticaseibacillus nasuensis]
MPTQYSSTGKASADLGVIKLATPIGKTTGYLGLTSAMPAGTRVTLAGYAVAAGGNLGVATGNLQTVSGGMATYTLDTSAGDSGSGLFSTTHRIGVVHTLGSSTMNEGVALTAAWVAWLNQWRAKATSVAANHLVTITKPLTIWQTVTFQRKVATARLGTVYRVRREYLAPNGYYYDALYDGTGKLRGVINRGAVTTLKATPVRQCRWFAASVIPGGKIYSGPSAKARRPRGAGVGSTWRRGIASATGSAMHRCTRGLVAPGWAL